ncbi:hypothetical protein [Streptomyces sp. NPDC006631]|uniref:hypothetical protein n=1 Tax=Streptomyces sp. NPDC006631 TaxID=3364752 RepID=UPI00368D8AB0
MSNRRRSDSIVGMLAGLALAVFVIGALWIRAEAPCSWFGLTPAKDVPARCLMNR